jgi:hypothetical protein
MGVREGARRGGRGAGERREARQAGRSERAMKAGVVCVCGGGIRARVGERAHAKGMGISRRGMWVGKTMSRADAGGAGGGGILRVGAHRGSENAPVVVGELVGTLRLGANIGDGADVVEAARGGKAALGLLQGAGHHPGRLERDRVKFVGGEGVP